MARKRKQPEAATKADSDADVKPDLGVSAKAAAKVADSLASSKYTGPFQDFERPTEQECRVRRSVEPLVGPDQASACSARLQRLVAS